MQSRQRIVLAISILLLLIAAAVWRVWHTRHDADVVTLYGNVDIREVELSFRVPGRLQSMSVDEGNRVKQGQQLAMLDAQPYRDALAVTEARVHQAQANLDKFRAGNRPQEVQQASAAVREAQAAFANAERELKRQKELFAAGASAQKAFDAAQARHDETSARLASAREALAVAKEGFRREDIAAADAELNAAIAQRDQARTQLDDTVLLAPSAGTILARVREPGSMLPQGAPVYTLSLDSPVYIRAYVGEVELGRFAPGTLVSVTTDASLKRYEGRVGFVSPRAEFTPKSVETEQLRTDLVYRVRIVVSNADAALRQGMPVTVHLTSQRQD
jgi:HlyD family secretion protein